jgi:hypothetical protein
MENDHVNPDDRVLRVLRMHHTTRVPAFYLFDCFLLYPFFFYSQRSLISSPLSSSTRFLSSTFHTHDHTAMETPPNRCWSLHAEDSAQGGGVPGSGAGGPRVGGARRRAAARPRRAAGSCTRRRLFPLLADRIFDYAASTSRIYRSVLEHRRSHASVGLLCHRSSCA